MISNTSLSIAINGVSGPTFRKTTRLVTRNHPRVHSLLVIKALWQSLQTYQPTTTNPLNSGAPADRIYQVINHETLPWHSNVAMVVILPPPSHTHAKAAYLGTCLQSTGKRKDLAAGDHIVLRDIMGHHALLPTDVATYAPEEKKCHHRK